MFSTVNGKIEIPELKTEFLFRRRPVAIPGNLRPAWRIGLLTLLLNGCCRSARTSLARLHVLSWGVSTDENRYNLLNAVEGALTPDSLIVRFDPFLNRAIDFAIGEGLVRRCDGSKIELTSSGKSLANELLMTETIYVEEKRFISVIRLRVTETLVSHMFR